MENQLESGFQGRIIQFPWNHWRILTATINGYAGRDIMALDVPNTLTYTNMIPNKYGEERVIMKITGMLVDMIFELDIETYKKHVVFENGKKVIYDVVMRAIYGMLVADLLLYAKFCGDLENVRFWFNP